ncbi:protein CASC3 [Osmerus eperlanus]|uniref:protein CASC3 n=1 Tax=Osmerus eperlanus TaxID=29151 RepID=UPI002E109E82
MADRRRRRRRASQDSEEDDESGSGSESARSGSPSSKSRVREPEPVEAPAVRVVPKNDAESECESEDGVGEAVLSDYESADPEENGSHSEGGEDDEGGERFSDEEEAKSAPEPKPATEDAPAAVEEEGEGEEEEGEEEEGEEEGEVEEEQGETKELKSEEKGNLSGERQSGDGQESTDDPETQQGGKPGQKLDDDEDRKNPAYIPRKGLFFEHDVRGHAPEEERPKGRHRKLWKDEGRWEHDRFREEEQAPKSRDELVAIYGYDIRNGGGSGDRSYRQRKPRHSTSPVRDKRWRDGAERPVRTSWQGSTRSAPPAVPLHPPGPQPSAPPGSQRNNNTNNHPKSSPHPPPSRGFQGNRPSQAHAQHRSDPRSSYRSPAETTHHRNLPGADGDRSGGPRGHGWGQQVERSPSVVVEDVRSEEDEEQASSAGVTTATTTTSSSQSVFHHHGNKAERDSGPASLPRRQEQRAGGGASGTAEPACPVARDASPPPERPVERKSYSLARRTRSRPAELGKQASLEDPPLVPAPAAGGGKGEGWQGPAQSQGDGPSQTGGLTGLDQDLARLSLAGQNWGPNPHSYLRAEMRGIPSPMHVSGAPPQYPNMEELGVGANRAKRYSSQRQRAGPEPAPLHIGVMEGHYYEPMSFQGPIYAHGDSPAPLPPQGMLVQPEMHLPLPGHPGHPGLHPHQSGAPMPSPGLYAAPPVSMSPGQPPPQQLLAPPFYPPPGVMTFSNTNYPYPAGASLPPMFNPQSQVYGGVTYYDTVQQQAQPKPSPPRRSSQPVTIKPPPPEMAFAPE